MVRVAVQTLEEEEDAVAGGCRKGHIEQPAFKAPRACAWHRVGHFVIFGVDVLRVLAGRRKRSYQYQEIDGGLLDDEGKR